ncbi:MAG TPA: hypothetical protein VHK65_06425 [Candidatus Dormibacteraeota bacterium]|nr:hypothetical protein [Candidatus Dormibacteraeota bacterium]
MLTALLALPATLVGILTSAGHRHHQFVSLRDELVSIQGGGLYGHESVSAAAQGVGLDVVTLIVGIPLLLVATYLARTGSLRAQLLQSGALFYFAYTYLIFAFGAAYNPFFLVYVALFSASSFALVLSVLSIDVGQLQGATGSRLARRRVGGLLIGIGVIVLLLWLGRILPSISSNSAPPGLESYTTLVVQAVDLSLIVPLLIVAGVLLLRRHPVGYLLSPILLLWATTFGLALIGIQIAAAAAGIQLVTPVLFFAVLVAVVGGAATIHLFINISSVSSNR